MKEILELCGWNLVTEITSEKSPLLLFQFPGSRCNFNSLGYLFWCLLLYLWKVFLSYRFCLLTGILLHPLTYEWLKQLYVPSEGLGAYSLSCVSVKLFPLFLSLLSAGFGDCMVEPIYFYDIYFNYFLSVFYIPISKHICLLGLH